MNSPPPTILIVDDDIAIRQLLEVLLRSEGYFTVSAASGEEALASIEQQVPDLILLDVMMPEMDGYAVATKLKQDPVTERIPIIFVTGLDQSKAQEQAFAFGAADYITKPFVHGLVIARVNVHIQLKLKSELFEKLAFIDGLTDIHNRRALEDTLIEELGRSKRNETPLSAVMIDIDHFKIFNDTYGHGEGDKCLRKVAGALMKSLLRPGDFIGRYGGEEFCVVLPDCNSAGAAMVAEKLRAAVESLNIPHGQSSASDHVTVSIGYTTALIKDGMQSSDLIGEADKALYQAKRAGRNRTARYERAMGSVT